jgi:hypothetical protein
MTTLIAKEFRSLTLDRKTVRLMSHQTDWPTGPVSYSVLTFLMPYGMEYDGSDQEPTDWQEVEFGAGFAAYEAAHNEFKREVLALI